MHTINWTRILFVIAIILTGCTPNYENLRQLGSRDLGEGIYVDSYLDVSGGVYASSTSYYFLTDRESFNILAARVHQEEGVLIDFNKNGVYVNLYADVKRTELTDSSFYLIEDLKFKKQLDKPINK
ncbi:MAG: hypothetical protein JKY54_00080 [Flavobacteriales bacterium]|nr:hypothetical protein [Flavobacteriales bacterium]